MAATLPTLEEIEALLERHLGSVRSEIRQALAATRDEQLLTPTEAAKARGVGLRTMQRWIATGTVPSVGSGRGRRVKRSDLMAG